MGSEAFAPIDIDSLVQFNKELMEKRSGHFGVNRVELDGISRSLEKFLPITDDKKRITTMAAWTAYSVASQRPFFNGNKRSATIACIQFLNANGYDLLVELLDVKVGWHKLLTGVQASNRTFDDVKDLMKRKVVAQPKSVSEPWQIYRRAPDLMTALDLEDASLIGREGEGTITVELLEKIRASHADLAEALAHDDPSYIKDD